MKTWSWIKVEMFILCISSIALHVRRGWLSRLEISFWLTTASRQQHTTCVLLKLQIRQLNTVVEPSCASRSCSVYCVPAWWRPLTRQRRARSSASFYRSKRTTAVPCAGCRRRTGRWRTSSTESTVCHRAITDVLLAVRRSTTGKSRNSANSSTTSHVPTTLKTTASSIG